MGAQDSNRSWHELPFWTLVKNYLKSFTIGAVLSYALTRFFNLDLLVLEFHIQNLWLILPESFTLCGALYIWSWSRKSEQRKKRRRAQKELASLLESAGGGKK